MQVDFYHLTQVPLERALPQIAEKILASGGRLVIVADDAAQRARLDQLLWSYSPESFLPHGQAGGEDDSDQPVLIAATTDAANGARNVALVDGIWRDEALGFDRAFHFFDETRIADARAAWKGLADRDSVTRNYWKQNDAGRWEKAA
ncbi:DNA polymerase-3 subunit chi [Sphingomonas naasensis]|uniref:DNA polymerase III subunit chi n=1 Tax=Sphingomonas naasensis TaxID=1344951 RepID=A0A4S1WQH1_9SPHN|nr:DNA polymerase III subunit chi [Sphingomonas naasensis]NIJ20127.1 DNA polymerase-3 subunit chi [Sphingomonas naasensis]TGX44280.1 DNA polymerase III subunit chi [Sphingomonas naasensis]